MISNVAAAEFLAIIPARCAQLIWTDPPYGTGRAQSRYGLSYDDDADTALDLISDLGVGAQRCLTDTGVLAVMLDHRMVHKAAVELERCGLTPRGEIVWHSQLGGISRNWWTTKHATVLLFDRDGKGLFNGEAVPMVPRESGRGAYDSPERRINSVWSKTFGPSDGQRVGYPTQKPTFVVDPFIEVHTNPGDVVVDPFGGSGTVAAAAEALQRRWYINDISPDACKIMRDRMGF